MNRSNRRLFETRPFWKMAAFEEFRNASAEIRRSTTLFKNRLSTKTHSDPFRVFVLSRFSNKVVDCRISALAFAMVEFIPFEIKYTVRRKIDVISDIFWPRTAGDVNFSK